MENLVIKKILKDKKMSYDKLAEVSGISRNSINMMLNNRAPITDDKLRIMCEALGITAEDVHRLKFDEDTIEFTGARSKYKTESRNLDKYIKSLEQRVKEQEKEMLNMAKQMTLYERFIRYIEDTGTSYKKFTKNMH